MAWLILYYGWLSISVPLKVAADYMLHICAEVDGRDVGSVCNYLIVCVGEIIDKVLEEIKKLRPRELYLDRFDTLLNAYYVQRQ